MFRKSKWSLIEEIHWGSQINFMHPHKLVMEIFLLLILFNSLDIMSIVNRISWLFHQYFQIKSKTLIFFSFLKYVNFIYPCKLVILNNIIQVKEFVCRNGYCYSRQVISCQLYIRSPGFSIIAFQCDPKLPSSFKPRVISPSSSSVKENCKIPPQYLSAYFFVWTLDIFSLESSSYKYPGFDHEVCGRLP